MEWSWACSRPVRFRNSHGAHARREGERMLLREPNLPEGANLVDNVDKALETLGLADELRGQPVTRKVDAALQTLGVTPQTSVPMGTPASIAPVTAPPFQRSLRLAWYKRWLRVRRGRQPRSPPWSAGILLPRRRSRRASIERRLWRWRWRMAT